MAEDRELDERLARLESRLRVLESAGPDPWASQPTFLDRPHRAPSLEGPTVLPPSVVKGFWAWASANASDGDNKWSYTFAEIEKTSAGYGGWAALTGGRTGTMRNTIEDINAAAGVQGNGVTAANLDTADYTFTIQPLPNSVPVWVREVVVTDNTVEYWFSYANGVDGSCD